MFQSGKTLIWGIEWWNGSGMITSRLGIDGTYNFNTTDLLMHLY